MSKKYQFQQFVLTTINLFKLAYDTLIYAIMLPRGHDVCHPDLLRQYAGLLRRVPRDPCLLSSHQLFDCCNYLYLISWGGAPPSTMWLASFYHDILAVCLSSKTSLIRHKKKIWLDNKICCGIPVCKKICWVLDELDSCSLLLLHLWRAIGRYVRENLHAITTISWHNWKLRYTPSHDINRDGLNLRVPSLRIINPQSQDVISRFFKMKVKLAWELWFIWE